MKKYLLNLAIAVLLLFFASCKVYEVFDENAIVFLNFSPQTVKELKVFNVNDRIKNDCVYTYNGAIETYNYLAVDIPPADLPDRRFFIEVQTEDGEIYSGGIFWNYSTYRAIYIHFSVDYELYEG